jgi:hypothetical protein
MTEAGSSVEVADRPDVRGDAGTAGALRPAGASTAAAGLPRDAARGHQVDTGEIETRQVPLSQVYHLLEIVWRCREVGNTHVLVTLGDALPGKGASGGIETKTAAAVRRGEGAPVINALAISATLRVGRADERQGIVAGTAGEDENSQEDA